MRREAVDQMGTWVHVVGNEKLKGGWVCWLVGLVGSWGNWISGYSNSWCVCVCVVSSLGFLLIIVRVLALHNAWLALDHLAHWNLYDCLGLWCVVKWHARHFSNGVGGLKRLVIILYIQLFTLILSQLC